MARGPALELSGRLLLSLVGIFVVAACSDHRSLPPVDGDNLEANDEECEDADGDKFGPGCARGMDCDDSDDEITNQCLCDVPNPGCDCSEEGEHAACGTVHSKLGQQVICGQGITSCDGDSWGECIINNSVTLKSLPAPSRRTLALGEPAACVANPCDPDCHTFTDTLDNLVVPPASGVVTSPTGITLQGGESIIVPGISGTGFNCTNSTYPANGGCAHHICRVGTKLNEWCDGVAPVEVPLSIFTDNFASSSGWTLGSNWAIGSATTSTGHTSGNADPATDATSSTTDNRIAGTVIGGNLGGGVTLFTDAFSSLGTWTETGEGDWVTQSRDSSTGYAATGSGNPVAHSDDCDTTCTLTLTSAVNLSTYSAATLNFQWYLSDNLESGEYLKAEAYNGTTWTQIFNKSTTADQDSTWHAASISLASYLVSGFKVRFVTNESSSNEAVEVDDVNVTAPPASVTSYFTSPAFNTAASVGTVTLSFKRWLNLNTDFVGKVQVYNGTTWSTLYTSSGAVTDSSWQSISYDLTPYKSAATQIRFSYTGSSTNKISGWNIDDVSVVGTQLTAGTSLCVHDVCTSKPSCCSDSWTLECVQLLDSVCDVECAIDGNNNNSCIACFNNPALTQDLDGDGQSPATGDCRECDPGISAGAYDLPGNNLDENCDGTPDNEVTNCDSTLSASGDAMSHAKAMGLCKVASGNSWGVVSAAFVRANGSTACTDSKQYQIMSTFGTGNLPTEGGKMSAFSSGTARAAGATGYVKPDGSGYDANTSSTAKYAVPAASGCNSGTAGYDSCGLKLVIKAPTNAKSFGYNFNFFTSEYPEWLCTSYNDAYVAYYEGTLNTQSNKNISFDSASNPVSVNNGLFTVPGTWPPPSAGTNPGLNGTGYDGVCSNNPGGTWFTSSICGGSTGWLQTTAPVAPGEQITLIYNVWDTGDHKWDSTVLLDNFTWSTATASIQTGHYTPGTGDTLITATYDDGWFTRDYDMSGVCDVGTYPVWSLWSWSATTPGDSKIEFYVQASETAGGLDSAVRDALIFRNPPGPAALAGQPAVAKAGSPNTQVGSAPVQDTLEANNRPIHAKHVRISVHFVPTTDLLQAPVLATWNLQSSCVDSE